MAFIGDALLALLGEGGAGVAEDAGAGAAEDAGAGVAEDAGAGAERAATKRFFPTRTRPEDLNIEAMKESLRSGIAELHAAGLADEAREVEDVLAAL